MLAPHNADAARPGKVGGAAETMKKSRQGRFNRSGLDFQVPRLGSSPHIDLDTLEEMSFWRLDLTRRIKRAEIRFMFADTEVEGLHDLAREVADFRKCCRALAWRPEAA